MSFSLPSDPPGARSLTGVGSEVLAALDGDGPLPAARSAIVLLADGLGRLNLGARAGHARFLTEHLTKRDAARTVFPSTTASAVTSLLTGVWPGEHGVVGYRTIIPGTEHAANQLRGYETDGLDPLTWQRTEPLITREAARGRPMFVVAHPDYRETGFTIATQRGASFVDATSVDERVAVAAELTAAHDGAFVYLYTPELDSAGHRYGWESPVWTERLEQFDASTRTLNEAVRADVGIVVTADHGMVDVPRHRQVLLTDGDDLVRDVDLVAGEPRMLHLYTTDPDAVYARWLAAEGERSWVMTRQQAVDAGLFGATVDPEVVPRIGDVMVAARAQIAYYDDREADKRPQNMIGQHGSLTDAERMVPVVRLGAFAQR